MADTLFSLAQLIKINDRNLSDALISDLRQEAPFLMRLPADQASNGTQHKYLKETQAPVVGFRDVNDGRDNAVSDDTLVSIDLKLLDFSFVVDSAIADGYDSVYGSGRQAFLDREGGRHLAAAMFKYEQQLINGTGADAAGFNGMADVLNAIGDTVISAGGSTAAQQTSCYLVREGRRDCVAIVGNAGNLKVDPAATVRMTGASGAYYGLAVPGTGWMGMQAGSKWSIGRIANIETTFTDDTIAEALAKFPANRRPTVMVMNPTTQELLRKSRTATNPSGTPAPLPETAFNIPIVVTDAITNTEAVVS